MNYTLRLCSVYSGTIHICLEMLHRLKAKSVHNLQTFLISSTVFPLYRISYMWYTFFGAMVAITVASISTCIFGGNDPADIDSSLLTPWIRNRFHKKVKQKRKLFLQ